MDRQQESDYSFKFRRVQIFRDQELGHGSYGAVYKAKCDSLPCAAKLIYPVLFASNVPPQTAAQQAREHRQPLRRFEAECRFLSQIKHPNIVQYLGVYHDPGTNVPVLLMELMDESLTHFLEAANSPVLFHIQVNILHDTALALAFLHSNGITHRDMSSNNVLLIAGCRAKVTDFGMSTLADNAGPRLASLTQCPGTPAYMSPEALAEKPVYSEKLDCFSFGVLTIQVITQEFPKPTDRFQTRELVDPTQPSLRFEANVPIPELERRQAHISLVPQDHPLLPIALNCLKKKEERPSTQELCESLEQLKSSPSYVSSIEQAQDSDHQLQELRQTIQEKEREIQDKDREIQDKERENAGLQQGTAQRDRQIRTMQQTSEELVAEFQRQTLRQQEELEDKDRQIAGLQETIQRDRQESQQLRKLLEQKNQQITQLQQGIAQGQTPKEQTQDLQTQLQQLELRQGQQQQVSKKTVSKNFKIIPRKGPKAPTRMSRGSSTIIGNMAYFNPFASQDVFAFNCNTTHWSTLPQCPYANSTLANIHNQLTTVGGGMFPTTNKLFTLCEGKWMELYPPMNTERRRAAVLSTNTHVIVMGGRKTVSDYIKSTEVLQPSTNQWSTASPLPYGMYWATTTLCGNNIYHTGGSSGDSNKNYSVICCNITELLQSTQSSKVWHCNIPDLPVRDSTCVTVQDQLLAIGGVDKQGKISNIIYKYNRDTNQWSDKGHMTMARSQCLATVLPSNNLLVAGGYTNGGWLTDEIEIAMIA